MELFCFVLTRNHCTVAGIFFISNNNFEVLFDRVVKIQDCTVNSNESETYLKSVSIHVHDHHSPTFPLIRCQNTSSSKATTDPMKKTLCSKWIYDTSVYEKTFVSQVSLICFMELLLSSPAR